MFIDFMGVCFDQIFNQAAKFRYMFGGKAETPVVIRAMVRRRASGPRRSTARCSRSIFTHIPGLKVVCPSNAYDAKGLLIQAIRDNDPVIFCEHKNLYGHEGEVPEESYAIPFGEANIVREGKHCHDRHLRPDGAPRAGRGGRARATEGIECEVIDLRTLSPLDMDTVLESVENTGRLVCVDEANPRCSHRRRRLGAGGAAGLRCAEGADPRWSRRRIRRCRSRPRSRTCTCRSAERSPARSARS